MAPLLRRALARLLPSIGSRSVLCGAHQFLLHPAVVLVAWTRLYGFPWDPRLWVAFLLHDLGYVAKPNMDGPEGERHPEWAAHVMGRLFGPAWYEFTLLHSRYYARQQGRPCSRLCVADKLAFGLTPRWLYLPLARVTGELEEYMALAQQRPSAAAAGKYAALRFDAHDAERWYDDVKTYLDAWVMAHRDGADDTWTPAPREEAA